MQAAANGEPVMRPVASQASQAADVRPERAPRTTPFAVLTAEPGDDEQVQVGKRIVIADD